MCPFLSFGRNWKKICLAILMLSNRKIYFEKVLAMCVKNVHLHPGFPPDLYVVTKKLAKKPLLKYVNSLLLAFSQDHPIYNFSAVYTFLLADSSTKILYLVTHPLAVQPFAMEIHYTLIHWTTLHC